MSRPWGYLTLEGEETIRFGDIWLRPTDSTWIEVGTAMVGLPVRFLTVAAARKGNLYDAISKYEWSSPRLQIFALIK